MDSKSLFLRDHHQLRPATTAVVMYVWGFHIWPPTLVSANSCALQGSST